MTLVPRRVRAFPAGSVLMTDPTATSSENASWVVYSRSLALRLWSACSWGMLVTSGVVVNRPSAHHHETETIIAVTSSTSTISMMPRRRRYTGSWENCGNSGVRCELGGPPLLELGSVARGGSPVEEADLTEETGCGEGVGIGDLRD